MCIRDSCRPDQANAECVCAVPASASGNMKTQSMPERQSRSLQCKVTESTIVKELFVPRGQFRDLVTGLHWAHKKKPGQGYTNDDRTSTRYSMILIVYVVSESAYSAFASLERKHRAKQSAATNTMIPAISVCPTQNIPPAMTTETKPKMSLYSAFSW